MQAGANINVIFNIKSLATVMKASEKVTIFLPKIIILLLLI